MRQQRREILDLHAERKWNGHGRNVRQSDLRLSLQNNLGMLAQQRFVDPEQHDVVLAVGPVIICPHDH